MAGATDEILLRIRALGDFSNIEQGIKGFQGLLKNLQVPRQLSSDLDNTLKKIQDLSSRRDELMAKPKKTKGDVSAIESYGAKIEAAISKMVSKFGDINSSAYDAVFSKLNQQIQETEAKQQQLREAFNQALSVKINVDSSGGQKVSNLTTEIEHLKEVTKSKLVLKFEDAIKTGDLEKIREAYADLVKYQEQLKAKGAGNAGSFENALTRIKTILDGLDTGELKELQDALQKVSATLDGLKAEKAESVTKAFEEGRKAVDNFAEGSKKATDGINDSAEAARNFNENLDEVKSHVNYFFGIVNVMQLVRRAIEDVVATIRELDESMSQIAVVSDFTVGDMWDKLPEYTQNARELGVATNELYQATALYIQQGLNSTQAMDLGVQTLKMARIANIEAAEATDLM